MADAPPRLVLAARPEVAERLERALSMADEAARTGDHVLHKILTFGARYGSRGDADPAVYSRDPGVIREYWRRRGHG